MKDKANYSIVRMTFEIETPNKKKKNIIYNKKVSSVIRVEDNEKTQEAFEAFVNSIEENQHELTHKSKNPFKSLWRNVRGYSRASEKTYRNILRS